MESADFFTFRIYASGPGNSVRHGHHRGVTRSETKGKMASAEAQSIIIWGMSGASSGACLGPRLGHHLGNALGLSGACLGPHLGHAWGIIWGMSGVSSGACLEQHLGHIVNNLQCYMHL